MNAHKFVICGKDCNKHESVIFACFDSYDECVRYLNKKGRSLSKVEGLLVESLFDINTFKTDPEISLFTATFEHVRLFEHLFTMSGMSARCTHKGAIHIACIERGDDFSDIYEWLSDTYV